MLGTASRAGLVAAFALVGALPAAMDEAWAQDGAPAADANDETIVVTGTRGRARTVIESPVAIDVLTARDLRTSGAVSDELGQALAALAPSFNFPRQSNSGSSDHVRAGQLRGLNPDQLLVLVNGSRRHPLGLFTRVAAVGLLVMTMVIQVFVYPDAWWNVHAWWSAVLVFIILSGRGRYPWIVASVSTRTAVELTRG